MLTQWEILQPGNENFTLTVMSTPDFYSYVDLIFICFYCQTNNGCLKLLFLIIPHKKSVALFSKWIKLIHDEVKDENWWWWTSEDLCDGLETKESKVDMYRWNTLKDVQQVRDGTVWTGSTSGMERMTENLWWAKEHGGENIHSWRCGGGAGSSKDQ